MDYVKQGANGQNGADGLPPGDPRANGTDGEDVLIALSGRIAPAGTGQVSILATGGTGGRPGRDADGFASPDATGGAGGDASIKLTDIALTADAAKATRLTASANGGEISYADDFAVAGARGNASVVVDGLTSSGATAVSLDFGAATPFVLYNGGGDASADVRRLDIAGASSLDLAVHSFVDQEFGATDFTSAAALSDSRFVGTAGADTFHVRVDADFAYSGTDSGHSTIGFANNNFSMGAGNDVLQLDLSSYNLDPTPLVIQGNVFDGGSGIDVLEINATLPGSGRDGPGIDFANNVFRNFEFLDYQGDLSYIGALKSYMVLSTLDGRRISYDLSVDGQFHQVVAQQNDVAITTGAAGSAIKLGAGMAVVDGGSGKDTITFGSGQAIVTGGEGGRNVFVFDRATLPTGVGDDALSIVTDFHRKTSGSNDADFIFLKGFSATAHIDYLHDVQGAANEHVYQIVDGSYHADFILEYDGAILNIPRGQYGFL